jgi:hypothetical protein
MEVLVITGIIVFFLDFSLVPILVCISQFQLVKIRDFIDKEELYDVLVEYLHKIYFR